MLIFDMQCGICNRVTLIQATTVGYHYCSNRACRATLLHVLSDGIRSTIMNSSIIRGISETTLSTSVRSPELF